MTSAKPFCDLCNRSTILSFLSHEAVAERLQRQCEQGFSSHHAGSEDSECPG